MTIYDVASLMMFFGSIAVLVVALIGALAGRFGVTRFILRGLAVSAVVYVGAWIAVGALAKQAPIGVGDPQCIDNWCIAVENVTATPREAITAYAVSIRIFSRAERTPTSFGAHAAADESSDFYLVDDGGRRYDPLPHVGEVPLNVSLQPGEAVRTVRIFEVPSNARGIGLLAGGGSLGVCPMIGECSTSHSASDYVLARGVYQKGSGFLALVNGLRRGAESKPVQWR
jgi:hypothetical protein